MLRRPAALAALATILLLAPGAGAQTGAPTGAGYREVIPGTLVSFDMVLVPGGTVTVDGTPVAVAAFYLGRHEVTWDMYDVFALGLDRPSAAGGADAEARPSEPYGAPDQGWGHAGYPVITITHGAAEAFAAWLSQKTGKRYRLPTEAQWLRAADLAIGPDGSTARRDALAWHAGNAGGRTHPVGTKPADALGLHDLFGNAAEWVTSAAPRPVARGGSFRDPAAAVDPAGIRSVLATYELARQKNLAIVAGTQRRHQADYLATIERIHGGALGEVVSGQVYWNQGGLWSHEHAAAWSDAEWQIRNWLYFTWLSGDHIVEQHVHNIDVANWVLRAHPDKATGVGGRQTRTAPRFGHIYDHFAVDFEYPGGAHVLSMCRQIPGTRGKIGEHFVGTKGTSDACSRISGAQDWAFDKPARMPTGYVQEHTNLVASLRAGRPLNELKQVAESTLTAIMGREAAYTGQEVRWDEILNARQDIVPSPIAFGPLDLPAVPTPGRTKLDRTWSEGW